MLRVVTTTGWFYAEAAATKSARSRDRQLVPRQATFARFTSSHSALSWALRFRQAM
jgi:hypothetical protein